MGDFHGKFPIKLKNKIKKEDYDYILCNGDFANTDLIRKYIFKYWTSKNWWEIIGIKKAKQIEKESFDSGLKIIKSLNSLGKKVYLVWGNADFYKDFLTGKEKVLSPGVYENKIKKLKNIILIERKKIRLNNIDIVGYGGYVDATEFIKHPIDKNKKSQKNRLKKYKEYENELKNLFLKNKPSKNFIFLTHFTPYKILDKIKLKSSPMNGKHIGWEPYNKIIKKYKPKYCICGHMHENPGKAKLYQTTVINPGLASESKAVILDLNKNKIKFL
ncbi:MAG: metallophosphoesterase [Candidatus Nanoarchaeia archaeon]|nr:metallophosphoesterase [Candidatus Nanoarchaeia archaeon]MDD5587781.1 metallophosphoesterase [Candidatus Nanoarchaeia archaeon]